MALAAACLFPSLAHAQVSPATINPPGPARPVAPAVPAGPALPSAANSNAAPGTTLDRIVAIVNGELILESDVDQELRLEELEPYDNPTSEGSRDAAINRLINRTLILQQTKLQNSDAIPDEAVDKELDGLRRAIPECKKVDCISKQGWDSLLASHGFTEASLHTIWKERMQVLAYIEERFKLGIRVTPQEIDEYYKKTMLPEYSAQHVTPPALETLSPRIEEVLLAQRVTALLDDWLKSLRAQGSVVVLHPGEAAP